MSGEDTHDSYPGKNYTLITVNDRDRIQFGEWGSLFGNPANTADDRGGNTEVMIVIREKSSEQETYPLLGNVYIMNDQGKTIATRQKSIN
jgi:hypothetical protein